LRERWLVDDRGMGTRRVVLVMTCVIVAALAVVLTVLQWEQANKVATSASALAGVAAVGVAVWAAIRGSSARVQVSNTGKATSGPGGKAVTGMSGSVAGADEVVVDKTGDADASGGGDASSGVQLS
jgi:hypothetical protein